MSIEVGATWSREHRSLRTSVADARKDTPMRRVRNGSEIIEKLNNSPKRELKIKMGSPPGGLHENPFSRCALVVEDERPPVVVSC
jgi:hypothetical protein